MAVRWGAGGYLRISAATAAQITYATWNPADAGAAYALSNGNLTCTHAAADVWNSVRATVGKSSGKWYWEVTYTITPNPFGMIGIGTSAMSLSGYPGQNDAFGWAYYANDGNKYTNTGTGAAYGNTWSNGIVMSVALDMDAGTITCYKGNVSQGVMFSGLSGTIFPASAVFKQTADFTANFGATPFTYAPPAGYNAGLFS